MKTLTFRGKGIRFTEACPVCLRYAHKEHGFERTFTYGRTSFTLRLPVLLCHMHYDLATQRTAGQLWCERLSPWAGGLLGLAAGAGLLRYWSLTGQGAPPWNILIAVVVGLSFAVTLWTLLLFWVAPLLASRETRSVLNSVQMTKYDPFRDLLELTFVNDTVAELTARENLSLLVPDRHGLRPYRIRAHILDHDIRLSSRLKTQVLLEKPPSEQEAIELLQPVIDSLLMRQMGESTFYEIDCVEVEEIDLQPEAKETNLS